MTTQIRGHAVVALAVVLSVMPASAEGLNTIGVSGGLTIPTAITLGNGTVALGMGTAREPQIPGAHARNVSMLLGIGLAPGLEIVGRFAENITRDPSGYGGDGISDLSANAKAAFKLGEAEDALRLGAGVNDITGGALNFQARYLVATKPWGAWDFTLGYGRSGARFQPGTHRTLDGAFGGIGYRLTAANRWGQVQLMVEHDARQPSVGSVWTSRPFAGLARMQAQAGLHRTFARDAMPAATALRLGLNFPIGENESRSATLPTPPEPKPTATAALETSTSRLSRLKDELVAMGFERVRAGRLGDGSWVVQYQNHRFVRHELDAMGVAVGKAAQSAPPDVRDIVVVALKIDQPIMTLRVRAQPWREFLDGGPAALARSAMHVQRGDGLAATQVDWINDMPSRGSWVQVRLLPRLSYTIGTEYGAFDYAAALRMEASVPVWTGGQVIVNAQTRVANSDRADPGGVFDNIRPPQGLRALALHQTFWWGERAVLGVAVGRFENGAKGAESEAIVFVPGRDDVLRVRGRLLELLPRMPLGADAQQWVSYRWVASPSTWLEAGWQRYGDRSEGPMVTLSRWWGDLGVHLTYRKGGIRQFGGLEISIPLTPSTSASVGEKIHIAGDPNWRTGLRTRITDRFTSANWVEPNAVPEYSPAWDLERRVLSGGRAGSGYTLANAVRMRQAFWVFGVVEQGSN